MRGWGVAALMLCGLAGCAADRFAGVDLRPGGAPADVQALARSARGGDKQAQLGLAERFERGEGVPRDIDAAWQLYRAAATASGGTQIIFVPQAKGGVSAVPVSTGARALGLPLAGAALQRVKGLGGRSALTPRGLEREALLRDEVARRGSRAADNAIIAIEGPLELRITTDHAPKVDQSSTLCSALTSTLRSLRGVRVGDCFAYRYDIAGAEPVYLVSYFDDYTSSAAYREEDEGHGDALYRPPFSLAINIHANEPLCGAYDAFRLTLATGGSYLVAVTRTNDRLAVRPHYCLD